MNASKLIVIVVSIITIAIPSFFIYKIYIWYEDDYSNDDNNTLINEPIYNNDDSSIEVHDWIIQFSCFCNNYIKPWAGDAVKMWIKIVNIMCGYDSQSALGHDLKMANSYSYNKLFSTALSWVITIFLGVAVVYILGRLW